MKISVAMTTYNGEKYIQKQLESLMNQIQKADEVIIADDLSKDNTANICRKFILDNNLTNWQFYVNEKNIGFIQNFRNAIERTTGDIIFLCDQDDIWLPCKIKELSNILKDNQKVLSVNSSFNFIDQNDKLISVEQKNNYSNQNLIDYKIASKNIVSIDYKTIIRYNISPGCTMAFRSLIKEDFLNQEPSKLPHDWEINLYASIKDGLYFYNKPLINYRIHSSNTIGIETEVDSNYFEIKGDFKKRKEVLESQLALSELLLTEQFYKKANSENQNYINHLHSYCILRQNVLFNKSFLSWLKLWFHAPYIDQGNPFKTILGDLIFMLNRQNHFKKPNNSTK